MLIVPVKAAGAAAGRNFCLQVQEIVPLFPLCKGNPIKFYGAYWLLQAFVSPVKSSQDTRGVTLRVCVCVFVCVWVHGGMCLRNIGAALCKYSRRRIDVCAHLAAVHERLYRVFAPAVRARGRRARGEARGDPTQTIFAAPRLCHMAVGLEKSIWSQV